MFAVMRFHILMFLAKVFSDYFIKYNYVNFQMDILHLIIHINCGHNDSDTRGLSDGLPG